MIKNFVVHFENLVKGQPAGYMGMFFKAYLGESGKNVESVQSCRVAETEFRSWSDFLAAQVRENQSVRA